MVREGFWRFENYIIVSKSNNKPPGLALENPSSVTYLL